MSKYHLFIITKAYFVYLRFCYLRHFDELSLLSLSPLSLSLGNK